MSIRFLADADLNWAIVIGVREREPALDFITATEADLQGQGDPEVLELAANQRRILISHDTSRGARIGGESAAQFHFARYQYDA